MFQQQTPRYMRKKIVQQPQIKYHDFFQAEDGIRDPLWSRGLGDVYKRQGQGGFI